MKASAHPGTARTVRGVLRATRVTEGAGLVVQRAFPVPALGELDPFLLLDHFGPVTFSPGKATGVPDHPHAGFEVVSYILQGRMQHRDSRGHAGRLGPGDVQWMTTGAGIIHSEMPEEEFARAGGTLEGIQLWLNLAGRDKRVAPAYGDVPATLIPVAETGDGLASVRVISGTALGVRHRLGLRTPLTCLHWTLQPGANVVAEVPADSTAFVYLLAGSGWFGSTREAATSDQLVLLDEIGSELQMGVSADAQEPMSALLLAAPAIGEPVARWGPFVMNTEAEIHQVMRDFQSGRLGSIR